MAANEIETLSPGLQKTFYALSLDPIHVGTGGSRLGRVDNMIVRDAGTNLPKIPGTSIAGVARACTAMKVTIEGNQNKFPNCAGKGGAGGDNHCGDKENCPVCATYGYSKGGEKLSFQGLAQFYDARILFFPVYTMYGPRWITSRSILEDAGFTVEAPGLEDNQVAYHENAQTTPNDINIGWLMMKKCDDKPLKFTNTPDDYGPISQEDELKSILKHLVLVPNDLIHILVNDNLEVRTSVSINPATGAAESGALFDYEAIPRATVFWFDVFCNKPEFFGIRKPVTWVMGNVEDGLAYLRWLGIGAMNTRGMGRMKILNFE
ncbi:MAG: type III-B CRISPR module RAMP protein Cmr4 [Candidatus Abyssobacteria bacterium SURF_17]|uniref:Type III-B CRISPR module RAMP protein Cmr4 n=1 Tax=Candidatus Abyssobacteria bacterium SURF_17 TaxID=2093361 RepID=A0A419F386_9BACT|nr:MAG: type III-B CRISPR module RAMP protein Cmr4 [Candidatus Abyssubacteria bacterium SURF_17]